MTNPIDNGSRVGSGVHATSRAKAAQSGNSSAPAAGADVAAADTRTESARLSQVRERIDATPEVDLERVAEIKQALAEGRLTVDPQRIAAKFAELEGLLND